VVHAVPESDIGEQGARAAEGVGRADDLERHRDVLDRRQGRDQVIRLKDVAERLTPKSRERVLAEIRDLDTGDGDRAGARAIETRDQPEQGRLSAAGGAR
jgi:hypothetical protein